MTKIEWVQDSDGNPGKTWNPIVGCSKISAGIQQAYRNEAMGAKLDNPVRLKHYEGLTEKRGNRVEWTGIVRFVPEALEVPLKTKKSTTWFVNSMSDLFHPSVQFEWLDRIFAVMSLTPHHTYQILTKRPDVMLEYFGDIEKRRIKIAHTFVYPSENPEYLAWVRSPRSVQVYSKLPLPNVWLGVTVERQKEADERIPLLLQTPAAVRFLSCEPLLEKIDWKKAWIRSAVKGTPLFKITEKSSLSSPIDWVIVGGESGANARPFDLQWARDIVAQCKAADVPGFMKQFGSNAYDSANPDWKPERGKNGDRAKFPVELQVREMPK
jgi:protein gp37